MGIKIKGYDNFGSGIAYYNDKIIFVPKTVVDDEVEINIVKEAKKYFQGEMSSVIRPSIKRVTSKCPYFDDCDGCHLRMLRYEDTLLYKQNKVKDLFYRNLGHEQSIKINPSSDQYRNKISLKIVDGVIGYFEEETNNIVEIESCLNAKKSINDFIIDVKDFKIKNGFITIRSNYNDELLIKIDTKDQVDIRKFPHHKIVGIVLNDELIFGEDHFMEIINGLIYNVSINSFFQVNHEINAKLHDIIKDYVSEGDVVLDLYCGVGSLTLPASIKAKKVYGVDNDSGNIADALLSQKINHIENVSFMLSDASKAISKIKDKINLLIVDPPRKGLAKEGVDEINKIKPNKIIYLSCDPNTLVRDLMLINDYIIQDLVILDMFPYTYHVETLVLMSRVDK